MKAKKKKLCCPECDWMTQNPNCGTCSYVFTIKNYMNPPKHFTK